MALRMVEVYHKRGKADEIDHLLKDMPILETWHDHLPEHNESITKILVRSSDTDSVLDMIQNHFPRNDTFRVVILPVEATIPRPSESEPEDKEQMKNNKKSPERISSEELYQKLIHVCDVSKKYLIMVSLASFVAALGLLKNDVAVIIGSMVIAPLFNPNMALALATTLADYQLARKAIITNSAGFSLAIVISIIMGFFMEVDPAAHQIAARSNVSHFYIFLALATGIAGAYSITTGVAEALVGVMVAVALLPPLSAAGLLFGGGYWIDGSGALLLCLVNVVCVNLAGVITFLFEGIQPKKWLETERARKAVYIAITVWIVILIVLAALIYLEQQVKHSSIQ